MEKKKKKEDNKPKLSSVEFEFGQLPTNLGLRTSILGYFVNDGDQIQMVHTQKGHCQPQNDNFPYKKLLSDNCNW